MKKNPLIAFFLVAITLGISVAISSCGKDKQGITPVPDWKVDTTGKYPVSMTAVVQLPPGLIDNMQSSDKLAAFITGECRGMGVTLHITDSLPVFYVMIHGTSSEQHKVSFRYYSGRNSFLYTTDDFLDFFPDGNYGTIDKPARLDLKISK